MAPVRGIDGETSLSLDAGWTAAISGPEGFVLAARAPGTAHEALAAAGLTLDEAAGSLHDREIWYRTEFLAEGPHTLRFHGLATLAEVFLDDRPLLASQSMFLGHEVDFVGAGRHRLAIRFAPLNAALAAAKGPRARWRPMMIAPGTLRLVRTTPLGHMPGWTPPVAVVGPWKPVELIARAAPFRLRSVRLIARRDGAGGLLDVEVALEGAAGEAVEIVCAGHAHALHPAGEGRFAGRLALETVEPWWPHTHGEPVLHPVALRIAGLTVDLGRVGFRTLAVDRGPDGRGFALVVNGERIFCRGATWTPVDPASPGGGDPRALLTLARDAGMNMLRLSGTLTPETQAFHDACDELGILVWHDLPFANFDYPAADPAFAALAAEEARQLLGRLQASPSLAVVCGGSEIAQQAVMLGLTPAQAANPLFDEVFPALAAEHAPGAAYVPHTPSGGPLPFSTDAGVTHYFGVGAYERPIEDVRRAEVRFASECLAFANVPSPARLRAEGLDPASPAWKAGVPRDAGAGWDFEDTRDHYVKALYGVDPASLNAADPERYLALGRAAPAEMMEQVFAEWRRPGSSCAGGLVWLWKDLRPGAGWGVVDHAGEPKSTWFALRRAFRPVHLGLTDEGLNGLGIHLVNETGHRREVTLSLAAYGEGPHPLARAETALTLAPRSAESLAAFDLLGRFFDFAHAYRFGPAAHDATLARLVDTETGVLLAEAAHVLAGRAAAPADIGLTAELVDGATLAISAERFARFVSVDDDGYRAGDEGFCLAPGELRRVGLVPRPGRSGPPRGLVRALNSHAVAYGEAP